jgi:hypothetical protein
MDETPQKRSRGRPRLPPKPPREPKLRGGKREGAGRPKGSININSMASVRRLEELDFDPIEMMLRQYKGIQKLLDSGEVKIGSGAHAQMIATQGQLINNLMAYGYKKIPDKVEIADPDKKPIAIKLTFDSTNKEEG